MTKQEQLRYEYFIETGIVWMDTNDNVELDYVKWLENKALTIPFVVNCVYVVTERDNYGEQLFKGVFANREKAVKYLSEDGLKESNIDEINEIELD